MPPDHFQVKVVELVTDIAAVASVSSPWWLPVMAGLSSFVHATLPVIGWLWIFIQIVFKFYDFYSERKVKK